METATGVNKLGTKNFAFLEAHLKGKIDAKADALRDIARSRPAFPLPTVRPQVCESESVSVVEESVVEESVSESVAVPAVAPVPTEGGGEGGAPVAPPPPPFILGQGSAQSKQDQRSYIAATRADDLEDYIDDEPVWKEKVAVLASLIKEARCLVIYTGAGISTSAKIPDYRSKTGVWTRMEEGKALPTIVDFALVQPTSAHDAVAKLVENDTCKLVVSTNVDGLHRRSGVPYEKIAELHGNCYREVCDKCPAEYLRDFNIIKDGQKDKHLTGNSCEKCGEPLKDSIVNFGECLPPREFQLGSKTAREADLALVLGSSLRVSPACNMPLQAIMNKTHTGGRGKIVIVNLQKTPFEDHAFLHIFAPIDSVMQHLLTLL